MSDLANKKCVPCEGNIPPFNTNEIHKYLKKVDGWKVIDDKIDGFNLIKGSNVADFGVICAIFDLMIFRNIESRSNIRDRFKVCFPRYFDIAHLKIPFCGIYF